MPLPCALYPSFASHLTLDPRVNGRPHRWGHRLAGARECPRLDQIPTVCFVASRVHRLPRVDTARAIRDVLAAVVPRVREVVRGGEEGPGEVCLEETEGGGGRGRGELHNLRWKRRGSRSGEGRE